MLTVNPIEANLTRDTEFLARMDPYCRIYLGGQCQRTQTCFNGSKHPHWNESFRFTTTDLNLRVEVWDCDTVNDDLVGAGAVNLAQYLNNGMPTNSIWVDLYYNNRSAGRVLLNVTSGGQNFYAGGVMGMGMGMMAPNTYNPYNQPMNQPMGFNPNPYNPPMGGGYNPGFNPNMGGGFNNGWGPNNNGWGGY